MNKCKSHRWWIAINCFVGTALFLTGQSAAQQSDPIVVDPDFGESITIAERNLTGYRKFPETIFVKDIKSGTIGMDPQLISYAVNNDPDFIKTVRYRIYHKNKNIEQTIGTLAANEASLVKIQQANGIGYRAHGLGYIKAKYKISVSDEDHEYVDAEFVRALTGTELFKNIKVYDMVHPILGVTTSSIRLDQEIVRDFQNAYLSMKFAKEMPPYDRAVLLEKAGKNIKKYPLLNVAAKLDFSKITFGEPITYTSIEKQLIIPSSLQKRFKVYWVEFAISFRDITRNDFEEISFNVNLPQNSRALELVPMSYAVEQTVQDEVRSPEIGVSVNKITISVGEVFKRTVAYKRLKPVIFATGLQESGFSWTMKDDAIENGSQRFIAVIGVPRNSLSIAVELSVTAKIKTIFSLQGDIAASGTVPYKIVF